MIRLATNKDLESIMKIIKDIQKEMKIEGNPQWNEDDDYPNQDKFASDIKKQALYVYEDTGIIKGLIAITVDNNEYEGLLATSKHPSYILHRLAIKKEYRNSKIASELIEFASALAKKNNIKILKGDTEAKNKKMKKLFEKLEFVKKGEFEYDDYPGHYIYYEKEIKE